MLAEVSRWEIMAPRDLFCSRWMGQDVGAAGSARNPPISAVAFADSLTAVAVGGIYLGQGLGQVILRTGDGGFSWTLLPGVTDAGLSFIAFGDPQVGWAVGVDGTILVTTDKGLTWSSQSSGTKNSLNAVAAVDANTAWAVGANGTIVATRTGGETWVLQTSGTAENLFGVVFSDANTGWAVGARRWSDISSVRGRSDIPLMAGLLGMLRSA
jgi:photosystem II stability/assembly factor-like uncharacterized protein